jgi:primosomal protein N' (replication factor Y)
MAIAKVEPLTTARALRGPFDYRVPAGMDGVGVGSLLLVPFGHRRVLGVVVELAEVSELPPERLAEPIRALEAGATPELVALGLWVARQYCSTPARGLDLVLPPGTRRSGGPVGPRLELRVAVTPQGLAAAAGGDRLGSRQREVLTELASGDGDELTAQELGVDRATLRRLADRGLVSLREERSFRRPDIAAVGSPSTRVTPSKAQAGALAEITSGMDGGSGRELLLWGVTGSGKTEVYLAAAEAALERGRGAIVLVPEIALTPQTTSRFIARFGPRVALLHSRLAAGERRDEWERVRSGEAAICVGPRSAVFAPVSNLGLVVIDEEHDPSYKQEGDPRYDARDVARHRARRSGAVLVAGTATPRPETWRDVPRVELPDRVDGRELPSVDVVDMREAGASPLHPRTAEALGRVRDAEGKAIVLLNRRGWSPFVCCRSCGRAWECPQCDVCLVLHGSELRCHHCGHAEAVPEACPDCGSVSVARHGFGTEQAASLIAAAVAPAPVFRLDSDTAASSGAHGRILQRFERAPAGVLVGTQMVAKGHDFPDVVLGVALDADATLRFPDFRAEERTFALITQLAGRSGRGERGGRVLVQTMAPDAPAIRHAAAHDSAGFLAGELQRRRELRYPPFAHLVRVELTSPDPGDVEVAASAAHDELAGALPAGIDVLGPAPRFRLRGRHRRQLLVKADDRAVAVDAVRDATDRLVSGGLPRGVALSVDVDPH